MATTDHPSTTEAPAAYDRLIERTKRLANLQNAGGVLMWDQQVMMPEGGAPARAQQLSAISASAHELLAADEVGEWLDDLEGAELTEGQTANVREMRRHHERAVNVPAALVEAIAQTSSENQQIWQDAKASDEFDAFAPRLERLRDLTRERAEYIDPDIPPYEVMYEDSHPYLPLETTDAIFDTLRRELPPLIEEIRDAGRTLADPFDGAYSNDDQRAACEAALDLLGYDRSRGRLDTAPHPFMSGNQFDARITTRFKPDDPIDALTATIHEFGHATYELGLPKEEYGTPLGSSDRSLHESQSRFWENHIGRTRPFWEVFLPRFAEHIEGASELTVDDLYEDVNRVRPDNLIRVEADELTYHMHIILRCEIDSAFVAGDLEVEEIPAVWNDKMEEYLGVRPDTDTTGCLQDIHWTSRFAAFQTYTIGSMAAAQLDAAIRDDLDVDALVRDEDFSPIREWMIEHVHRHGQRYTTPELVEKATGEALSAEYFVDYVREKFEELYGL